MLLPLYIKVRMTFQSAALISVGHINVTSSTCQALKNRLTERISIAYFPDNFISPNSLRTPRPSGLLGDGPDGLLWFVHVTDIHMSIFRDQERITEFQKLCVWLQNRVRPPVVVASGDLTDAKTSDHLGSTQWKQEWQFYRVTVDSFMKFHFIAFIFCFVL